MTLPYFDVTDWFWIVAGDESRAWSSAAGAYVTDYPTDRVTRIYNEQELTDVLAEHGRLGPVPRVPPVVTPYQARVAINAAGLRPAAEAAVAAADQNVKDAWEYGVEVRRDSLFIAAMQGGLGLSDEQLDALFIAASQVA
jgi:hypothetical protein